MSMNDLYEFCIIWCMVLVRYLLHNNGRIYLVYYVLIVCQCCSNSIIVITNPLYTHVFRNKIIIMVVMLKTGSCTHKFTV